MAVADFFKNLGDKIGQGPMKKTNPNTGRINSLENGGFTGFHKKPEPKQQRQSKMGGFKWGKKQNAQQENPTAQQRVYQEPLNHTGYQAPNAAFQQNQGAAGYQQPNATGYRAPNATGYRAPNGTGYQQPNGTGYRAPNGTGYQQPNGTGYQQPNATGYRAPNGTGYQQPNATGYQQQNATGYQQQNGTGFQKKKNAQQNATGYQQAGNAAQQPQQEQQQPASNISYINTTFKDGQGNAYRHVENIVQITDTVQCYHLIEHMRNQESVLVNVEDFDDERERQRCLDMLFGAAYTMECNFVRVAKRSVYLIAPKGVYVSPEDAFQQMTNEELHRRWPGSQGNADEGPQERAHGKYVPFSERYAR